MIVLVPLVVIGFTGLGALVWKVGMDQQERDAQLIATDDQILRLVATPAIETVLEARLRRQFVVTLKSGEAFRGVLSDEDESCIVLTNAEHFADPTSPVLADGEVIVRLEDVKYAQRL